MGQGQPTTQLQIIIIIIKIIIIIIVMKLTTTQYRFSILNQTYGNQEEILLQHHPRQ